MENMNRYRLTRELTTYIRRLLTKYQLINNEYGINVNVVFDKHMPDRILDRKVPKGIVESLFTRLIRNKICECIYLCEIGGGESGRINVKMENDYMLGITVQRTQNSNYKLKVRTIVKDTFKHDYSKVSLIEI